MTKNRSVFSSINRHIFSWSALNHNSVVKSSAFTFFKCSKCEIRQQVLFCEIKHEQNQSTDPGLRHANKHQVSSKHDSGAHDSEAVLMVNILCFGLMCTGGFHTLRRNNGDLAPHLDRDFHLQQFVVWFGGHSSASHRIRSFRRAKRADRGV